MKRLSLIALVAAFVVSAFAFLASSAFAIPVFARKYNTQCNMCHTVPPRLNKFGVAFKENGFELPPGTVLPESEVYGNQVLSNDEPKAIVGAGFPFMIRTGLNLHLANSTTTGAPAVTTNNPLSASLGEFGMIGGGSMETPFGGLGFWIDAPGAAIGAIDFDFNFNPMFKVAIGTDGPKAGYALALTPLYLGGRNPATQVVVGPTSGFRWGNGPAVLTGAPATVEVRGTTNPSTGLGLNYAVGIGLPAGAPGLPAAPVAAPNAAPSLFYGHVAYFIDAINSNIGVGYATESDGISTNAAGKQLLVDFAYGVGENFMATIVYNSVTPIALAAAPAPAATNYIAIQPEFAISPALSVGGRYAMQQNPAVAPAAATTATTLSVGANFKLLQNVLLWGNYTATDNGLAAAAKTTTSGLNAGIDFIF